ncbi:hypothetical protein GCM10010246_84800 [Streptomyces cuspidosporus]|uniref:Uncharacterized protein n=1 Tax=Streptomyces cuspidosporus TaxID=66882 RepID=A0ABN3HE06_9ACTN
MPLGELPHPTAARFALRPEKPGVPWNDGGVGCLLTAGFTLRVVKLTPELFSACGVAST